MKRDLWLLGLAILFVLTLSSLPSWWGFRNVPPGGWWTGILTRNTADANGYLSMIEEIRQGHYRARNLFTAEPHPPFQIRPSFLMLGLIGRVVRASNVVLMEAGRIFFASIFLAVLAILVCSHFHNTRERLIAFLVLSLGSGFGWLRSSALPLDLDVVETSTFLALLSPPLFTVSLSLLVGIFLCLEKTWTVQDRRRALAFSTGSGLLALWLILDRPFSVATLGIAVCGALILVTLRHKAWTENLLRTIPFFCGVLLGLSYQLYTVSTIPVYAQWNRQHVLPTPAMIPLLSAFGLLLPGALIGIRAFFKSAPALAALAGTYIIAAALLSHSPISFQERFLEGLPLCLALFACYGMMHALKKISAAPIQTAIATILLIVLTGSAFAAVTIDLAAVAKQGPPQYVPLRVIEGMQKLKDLASSDEAVLSCESSGNFIVAYAGRPVVLGQKIQTARYPDKSKLVFRFFHCRANDPEALRLFRQSGARWLFWGPEEAWLSQGIFHPRDAAFLEQRYTNRFITLYALKQ